MTITVDKLRAELDRTRAVTVPTLQDAIAYHAVSDLACPAVNEAIDALDRFDRALRAALDAASNMHYTGRGVEWNPVIQDALRAWEGE